MSTLAATDTQALEGKSSNMMMNLRDNQIVDFQAAPVDRLQRSLENASVLGRLADDFIREVDSHCDPVRESAHKTWKAAVKQQADLRRPAEQLKTEAGQLGWACNAELKRRQQEADRLVLQERERLQREADEAARIERQAAQRAQDDALLAEAARLEQAGDTEAATRLVEAVPVVPLARPAPVFVPPAPKLTVETPGQSYGETWGDFEVVDETLIPARYWFRELDRGQIRAAIISLHGNHGIPGIKATPKPRSTIRRAG